MAPLGRDFLKALIRNASAEARLQYGERVVIKLLDTANPGTPAQGVAPTYTFIKTRSRGIIANVAQRDVLNSGGLYQAGDISVDLDEELTEVSDTTRGIGDRVVWRGNEYRLVGKKKNLSVVDQNYFFSYVMRKVV